MRKAATIFVCLIVMATPLMADQFVTTKRAGYYHYPTCVWAQHFKPSAIIRFNSPEEAIKAGFKPCERCNPPISSAPEVNKNENGPQGSTETGTTENDSTVP